MMLPFERYQDGGRTLLGPPAPGDGSSRRGYGPPVFQECGYACAYCDWVMDSSYEAWLQLSVDHVLPAYLVGKDYPRDWIGDVTNLVTCCRACNEFLNGYRVRDPVPSTLEEFFDLRDRHFEAKRARIGERHKVERAWYMDWHSSRPHTMPPAGATGQP